MTIRYLLIAPKAHWDANFASIGDAGGAITRVAPIGIATVAAMAPPGIETILHDEAIAPVDPDTPADFVGISANVSQAGRAIELARMFRAQGRTVIIGGPHISLDPAAFADCCDVAVIGEFEGLAAEFFADMAAGALKPRYAGGKPDLATSPIPAWERFDNDRALMGVLQTSRGCPFECNFCDVIQYVGRVQRHKPVAQVIAEAQKLYDLGYNRIALADDNFTVYRRRTIALLEALAAWNGADGRDFVTFATQVSIDVAREDRILDLAANAGLLDLFIGIETVSEESLKAANKRQNLGTDMAADVRRIVRHGLRVEATMMVGFDTDGLDIFERQYAFGMRLPVGHFHISALVAPASTPLYDEMLAAGRIDLSEVESFYPGAGLITNIVPAQMSKHELRLGTRWLVSRLYRPQAFLERLEAIAAILGPNPLLSRGTGRFYNPPQRELAGRAIGRMVRGLARDDAGVAAALRQATALARAHPAIRDGLNDITTAWAMNLYTHIAKGSYDRELAEMTAPPFDRVRNAA